MIGEELRLTQQDVGGADRDGPDREHGDDKGADRVAGRVGVPVEGQEHRHRSVREEKKADPDWQGELPVQLRFPWRRTRAAATATIQTGAIVMTNGRMVSLFECDTRSKASKTATVP